MKHRFLVISLFFCLLFLASSSRVLACGNINESCCAIPDPAAVSRGYCFFGVCTGFDIYSPSDNGTCIDQVCGLAIGDPCCTTASGYDCQVGVCTTKGGFGGTCQLAPTSSITPLPSQVPSPPVYCIAGDPDSGINTALGCIKVGSGNELILSVLRLATGVGGGLALALILYGTFIVTTSAGMPDKLKAGSEIITSAIIGLLFILLSVFLVNLIGINILGIPGLT